MSRLMLVSMTLVVFLAIPQLAESREWTDSTGSYTIEADLIAFNDETVILKRKDGELGAMPIKELSKTDREYLKSKEAEESVNQITGKMQTWTMRDGSKIRGRVVDYARGDITLQRRRGKIYVNNRVFENLPEVYQLILPKVVANFEKINQPDRDGLEAWLVRQKGLPRSFTIEGVVLEFEDGDEYLIPFFFFSQNDLQVLKPGWDQWLAAHENDDYYKQQDVAFKLQSLAAARQRDQEVQRQIAMMQLNLMAEQAALQAVETGLTSLWEVTLYPARGNAGPPMWVVVSGRDSRQAIAAAQAQYAGYVAGPVRKLSAL